MAADRLVHLALTKPVLKQRASPAGRTVMQELLRRGGSYAPAELARPDLRVPIFAPKLQCNPSTNLLITCATNHLSGMRHRPESVGDPGPEDSFARLIDNATRDAQTWILLKVPDQRDEIIGFERDIAIK